jgi:formate hydrogenlyase subunit 3/multisubunit Na+/H+ antiporter MnhD subunit
MKKTYDFGFILFISGVAVLGGFLFGFDSAVINGTVKALAITFKSDALGSGFSVASALLSFFFVLKWIKETRGKTLEEMSDKGCGTSTYERI